MAVVLAVGASGVAAAPAQAHDPAVRSCKKAVTLKPKPRWCQAAIGTCGTAGRGRAIYHFRKAKGTYYQVHYWACAEPPTPTSLELASRW